MPEMDLDSRLISCHTIGRMPVISRLVPSRMMPEVGGLTLGEAVFFLGLWYALNAVHLAAVSTELAERPAPLASGVGGFWWVVGTRSSFYWSGGSIVLITGLHIPDEFEPLAESGVALLLMLCRYADRWL